MLAQVLGAERERFLLGEKNTYIIEGNWPAGAKMEVRLDGHEISAKLVSGEKEEELSRSEEAVRLLGEKKKITVELPEGWEKAHKLAVYAMENGQKNVWFRIPVRESRWPPNLKKREIVHKIKLVFTSDQSFKHCLRF